MSLRAHLAGGAALLLLLAAPAAAAPREPASDDEVLERVRPRGDPTAQALRALAAEHAARPGDPAAALALARGHLELAQREGDPRHLGQAEAVLVPWLAQPAPPNGFRLLRARLLQARHDFAAAIGDLDAVLAGQPAHAEALLLRATIRLVQGEPRAAAADCAALPRTLPPLVVAGCAAGVRIATGDPAAARRDLTRALDPNAPAGQRAWAQGLLADAALAEGDTAAAEAALQAGLAAAPGDVWLRAALADLLLATGRAEAVVAVTGADPRADALLLRRALAAAALELPEADALTARLLDRMAEAARRGDDTHLREAARLRLELLGDARRGLDLAARNWTVSREVEDARLVLAASLAAGRPDAARPVLDWIAATGLRHAALDALARRLAGQG